MNNKLLPLLSQIEINLFVLQQQKNTVIDFLALLNINAENRSLLQDFFTTFEHSLVNINTHVDVLKNELSTEPSKTIYFKNDLPSDLIINVLDSTDGTLLDITVQKNTTKPIEIFKSIAKNADRIVFFFPRSNLASTNNTDISKDTHVDMLKNEFSTESSKTILLENELSSSSDLNITVLDNTENPLLNITLPQYITKPIEILESIVTESSKIVFSQEKGS